MQNVPPWGESGTPDLGPSSGFLFSLHALSQPLPWVPRLRLPCQGPSPSLSGSLGQAGLQLMAVSSFSVYKGVPSQVWPAEALQLSCLLWLMLGPPQGWLGADWHGALGQHHLLEAKSLCGQRGQGICDVDPKLVSTADPWAPGGCPRATGEQWAGALDGFHYSLLQHRTHFQRGAGTNVI